MGASEGKRTNHWPCDGLAAVTATGVIWSRYSMVITPKNWNLFAVNVFMAGTGLVQFYRKFQYDHSDKVQALAKSATL
jgi:hypothetical protein